MSYCQKHTNHHCIHTHNCKDPSHKKKNNRNNSLSHPNKPSLSTISQKYHPPMGTIADNEECQFYSFAPSSHHSNLEIEAYIKQIASLQSQLQSSNSNFLTCDIENRKLKQRNSHLECQIEYLRQQLEVLVSNHNTDIHNEIKKSLIEHTQLNIKIKELTTALFDKEKTVEEISSENYSLLRKNKQLEASIKSFEEKVKLITHKNQEFSFENISSKNKIKQLQSQLKLLKSRYSTLATSADRTEKETQNKISGFQNQKQKLKKTHKAKQSELKRLKQLYEVEKKASEKMIAELRESMQKKDEECKKYRQAAKQAEESLNQVKEDFDHAKKMILKYEQVNGEYEKVREQTKLIRTKNEAELDEQEKKTVSKMHPSSKQSEADTLSHLRSVQKINQQLSQKVRELEAQLSSCQQPLQNRTNTIGLGSSLQPHTTIINQELILSIGASQQFKKIVQQKNAMIKKLMKEKAELHSRIYEQQAYRHS